MLIILLSDLPNCYSPVRIGYQHENEYLRYLIIIQKIKIVYSLHLVKMYMYTVLYDIKSIGVYTFK